MAESRTAMPDRIRVKLISMVRPGDWLRQFPGQVPVWGRCEFILDPEARDYDWLVVYDDLRVLGDRRCAPREELLACAPENTLLVTTEPSSIKTYGSMYTARFGHVLTSQAAWALPHRSRIYSQPALMWFYGVGKKHVIGYNELHDTQPWEKHRAIATVCSVKQQGHTLHGRRYRFTRALGRLLPELDVYGHGVKEMDDKAESLRDYRYHVAVENHRGPHHWTEKLADPFLALSLPFYYGCPNAADYFPPESFIEIDIDDVQGSARIIRQAMQDNAYERRMPSLIEARRRVLEEHNLFAVLAREIPPRHHTPNVNRGGTILLSRRAARFRNGRTALQYLYEKSRNRLLHRLRRS